MSVEPETVEIWPNGSTERIPRCAKSKKPWRTSNEPSLPNVTSVGIPTLAEVAGPPSPVRPVDPLPATVKMSPAFAGARSAVTPERGTAARWTPVEAAAGGAL
jgi:hypothetical protein